MYSIPVIIMLGFLLIKYLKAVKKVISISFLGIILLGVIYGDGAKYKIKPIINTSKKVMTLSLSTWKSLRVKIGPELFDKGFLLKQYRRK